MSLDNGEVNSTNSSRLAKLLGSNEAGAVAFYRDVVNLCLWKLDLGNINQKQVWQLLNQFLSTAKVLGAAEEVVRFGVILKDDAVASHILRKNTLCSQRIIEAENAREKAECNERSLQSELTEAYRQNQILRDELDKIKLAQESESADGNLSVPIHNNSYAVSESLSVFHLSAVLPERLTFWDIYKRCLQQVPAGWSFSDFQTRTDKGTNSLDKADLIPYIASYGGHHYYKIRDAICRIDHQQLERVRHFSWLASVLFVCPLVSLILVMSPVMNGPSSPLT